MVQELQMLPLAEALAAREDVVQYGVPRHVSEQATPRAGGAFGATGMSFFPPKCRNSDMEAGS